MGVVAALVVYDGQGVVLEFKEVVKPHLVRLESGQVGRQEPYDFWQVQSVHIQRLNPEVFYKIFAGDIFVLVGNVL